MKNDELRDLVTRRIVELLESGDVGKWVKPWVTFGGPRNLGSGRRYTGLLNILLLQARAFGAGFKYPFWATFNQIKNLGANVLKGQHASEVVFWKTTDTMAVTADGTEGEENSEGSKNLKLRKRLILQYFKVFNLDQTTLSPEGVLNKMGFVPRNNTPIEHLETFAKAQGISIHQGSDRACYRVQADEIYMPVLGAFESEKDYYATLFHELVHSTGHPTRLNRDQTGSFGSEAYSREEITAELGSLYLCAELGIEGKLQHPEYLKGWLEVLKADSKEIFRIAGHANRAVDLLLTKALGATTPESAELAS